MISRIWMFWAVLFVASQLLPLAFMSSEGRLYDIIYLVMSDLSIVCISLFSFSVSSWRNINAKMWSLAFSAWSIACLFGNGIIEALDITRPYEVGGVFIIVQIAIGLGCLRFLMRSIPSATEIKPGHLYLIISKPKTIKGAFALIISGLGGSFSVWSEKDRVLYKYEDDVLKKFHIEGMPVALKIKATIDMGIATDETMDRLNAKVGSKWAHFNNCLQFLKLSGS